MFGSKTMYVLFESVCMNVLKVGKYTYFSHVYFASFFMHECDKCTCVRTQSFVLITIVAQIVEF